MFKGNRLTKSTLLLIIGWGVSFTSMAGTKLSPEVQTKITQCQNAGGSYSKTETSREAVSDSGGKKVDNVCYDIKCSDYADVDDKDGSFDPNDPDQNAAYLARKQGGFTVAWGKDVCGKEVTTYSVDDSDIFGGGDDNSDSAEGSGSGSGAFVVIFEGKTYNCKNETYIDCLKRNGVNVNGSFSVQVAGDGNVFTVQRSSSGSGSVSVSGNIGAKCYAYERVWWKLWLGKSWVEKDYCAGGRLGTSGGTDVAVGIDIDDDLDGGRGRGSARVVQHNDDAYWWLEMSDGRRFKCLESEGEDECLAAYYRSSRRRTESRSDGCVTCGSGSGNRGDSWSSIIASVGYAANGILSPIMAYKGQKAKWRSLQASNEAWANACSSVQNNYIDGYSTTLDYYSSNELSLSDSFSSDYYSTMPSCNGYAMGAFAGMQGYSSSGWGGYSNGLLSAGYTSPFLGAYNGIYGSGMNGLGVNVTGGLGVLGMNGLYGNSLNGGLNGLNGSINLNGNLGSLLGINGGLSNGLYTGGLYNSGLSGSASMCLSVYASSLPGCSSTAMSTVPWNTGGNYYTSGSINPYNNVLNNNMFNNNSSLMYNSLLQNSQATSAGSYYQQQALANQANQALSNYYNYPYATNNLMYSSAAYSPLNLSAGLNGSFSFRL